MFIFLLNMPLVLQVYISCIVWLTRDPMDPILDTASCHMSRAGQGRKNDLILIMTPEKQDKTLELSKH